MTKPKRTDKRVYRYDVLQLAKKLYPAVIAFDVTHTYNRDWRLVLDGKDGKDRFETLGALHDSLKRQQAKLAPGMGKVVGDTSTELYVKQVKEKFGFDAPDEEAIRVRERSLKAVFDKDSQSVHATHIRRLGELHGSLVKLEEVRRNVHFSLSAELDQAVSAAQREIANEVGVMLGSLKEGTV